MLSDPFSRLPQLQVKLVFHAPQTPNSFPSECRCNTCKICSSWPCRVYSTGVASPRLLRSSWAWVQKVATLEWRSSLRAKKAASSLARTARSLRVAPSSSVRLAMRVAMNDRFVKRVSLGTFWASSFSNSVCSSRFAEVRVAQVQGGGFPLTWSWPLPGAWGTLSRGTFAWL